MRINKCVTRETGFLRENVHRIIIEMLLNANSMQFIYEEQTALY